MDWELLPIPDKDAVDEAFGFADCIWAGDSRGAWVHFAHFTGIVNRFIHEPDLDEEMAFLLFDFTTPPVDSLFRDTTFQQENEDEGRCQRWLSSARGKPWGVIGRVRKPRNSAQRISHQLGFMRV
jgi:hypothetical protein